MTDTEQTSKRIHKRRSFKYTKIESVNPDTSISGTTFVFSHRTTPIMKKHDFCNFFVIISFLLFKLNFTFKVE